MSQFKRRMSVGFAAVIVSSCSSGLPPHLQDARDAYQRASQGPAKDLAPAQLHAAQVSLELAEKTYKDEGKSANAGDRAYVAQRKAELAEVQAQIAADMQQVEQIKKQQAVTTQQELEKSREQLNVETQRREDAERAEQKALATLQNVKNDSRGTVVTVPGSISFASGKAKLLPAARGQLSEVATALKQGSSDSKIVVEGYTDSTGSPQMNQELSQKRAEAVRQALVSDGVPADRVSAVGYGESRPVADNSSPEGRATNRRVEIVVQPGNGNNPKSNQPS
ncbi:MAG TPA: OmpA family protein [Polyangiaceae bacterium]|nr:OmpA family protein [Polyangiaceae bacterium]